MTSRPQLAATTVDDPYDALRYRRYVLGLLTLIYAFSYLDRQVLVILQESIKRDLSLSDTQLGLLSGFAFVFFYTTLGLLFARFADRGERRTLLACILGLWSAMTALCGSAQSFVQMFFARIGVGIGEAGCNPSAHSMISDIYPPGERALALAVYGSGINIGVLLGFLGGGWFNQWIGWRGTFVVLGLAGLLLVPLLLLSVREPRRGRSEQGAVVGEKLPPFREVFAIMRRNASFRQMLLACCAASLAATALAAWMPSCLIRVHGLDSATAGSWLALLLGVGGAAGTISGGWLADRLARRSFAWYARIPALCLGLSIPLLLGTFFAQGSGLALACYVFPAFALHIWLGPTFSLAHSLVGNRMRGLASSIIFLSVNLVGAFGPLLVGLISDALADRVGTDSLRYALAVVVTCALLWSVSHYTLATRLLKSTTANVPS
jgi:predicted MFS family arabinose efflux permease